MEVIFRRRKREIPVRIGLDIDSTQTHITILREDGHGHLVIEVPTSSFVKSDPREILVSDHYDGLNLWYPDDDRGFFLASLVVREMTLVDDNLTASFDCKFVDPETDERVAVRLNVDEPVDTLMSGTPSEESAKKAAVTIGRVRAKLLRARPKGRR